MLLASAPLQLESITHAKWNTKSPLVEWGLRIVVCTLDFSEWLVMVPRPHTLWPGTAQMSRASFSSLVQSRP